MKETKFVYDFSEGKADMKELLGGKGANLAEMTNLGIRVPFGFTITTEACDAFAKNKNQLPFNIENEIEEKVKLIEEKMGAIFGDPENPLLLSVRSGAAVSMPGMMDTVLNLGLNSTVVDGLVNKSNNIRFAMDSYRRFIQMFGDVVMEVPHHEFESILNNKKQEKGFKVDTELSADDLKEIADEYIEIIKKMTGKEFPQDPKKQLIMSVAAVFNSWNNERAILYRRLNDITGLIGTAVNVQAMVFGNLGETSGTGVCFTRDPSTGENIFYGEYLMNAQGEDVVAGIRTPNKLDVLEEQNPEVYNELCSIRRKLEDHYKEMQDMEFTIQKGKLYMLQTRTGKRTAAAAVRIAVEMVGEGLISKEEALLRVDPDSINQLLHKQLDKKQVMNAAAKGFPASPGAAVGQVVFDAHVAHEWAEEDKNVILVRNETSPEDLIGMNAAQGILTSRGGMTSHAAVVARGMGKSCVAGCIDLKINEKEKYFEINDKRINEGDYITLEGSTGEVFIEKLQVEDPEFSADFEKLMEWADEIRTMNIRTNADTPDDAKKAIKFGAEGIGLCRTEHMFFEGKRITAMREMILADDVQGRIKALDKILPFQKADFKGIFEVMNGKPVTIRLLDPPLHEFLPKNDSEIKTIADNLEISTEKIKQRISALHEENPMLGHRGCRLGITYPEITEMQTKAIIMAALETGDENLLPEIMIPLVGTVKEFNNQKSIVIKTADKLIKNAGSKIEYKIGTMIEVPRGALTADLIAKEADFFSFGTNDLTQMTMGYSRDDVRTFIPEYLNKGILPKDPFQVLDQEGVGQLIHTGITKGRAVKPGLKVGICGEHGGEPSSIAFCYNEGLDYVSCSPYRVPIARLAAAQAVLRQ